MSSGKRGGFEGLPRRCWLLLYTSDPFLSAWGSSFAFGRQVHSSWSSKINRIRLREAELEAIVIWYCVSIGGQRGVEVLGGT